MAGISGLPKSRRQQAPFFSRAQIAGALSHVGVLLELKGANPFRVRAYQNGSRIISSLNEDLWLLASEGRLTDVKGIGKGLAAAILMALEDGDWGEWIELHQQTPSGLIDMLEIPNLGPKRIKQIYDELGIDTISDLLSACEDGAIETLDGFGLKSQNRIIEGIALVERYRGRRRIDAALRYGQAFLDRILDVKGVKRAQLAGSARRRRETVGDLDVVIAALPEDAEAVQEAILRFPGIASVKGAGSSKTSLILSTEILDANPKLGHLDANVLEAIGGESWEHLEASGTIDAQIRIVLPERFAFTLAYFTGSKEHNIRMRKRAIERGLRLNEFGLIPESKMGDLKGEVAAEYSLPAKEEAEIYRLLQLDFVEPELREDMGEIEAAEQGDLPQLIEMSDIQGAFHNHTTLSDGQATLEQMAEAAQRMGWTWLGISDHSQSLRIASGAEPEDLLQQGNEIAKLNQEWKDHGTDFRLFHGSEVDIDFDGSLDYDDETLATLDHVIVSVHQPLSRWQRRDELENAEVIMEALSHPSVTMLGHPTGRILGGRDGYPLDIGLVIENMSSTNLQGRLQAIELNASPYRLDTDWRHLKRARNASVPVAINPDAHSIAGLADLTWGIAIARKGWLRVDDVLNTCSVEELTKRGLSPRK